jgi:hypothetical protein
MRTATMTTKKHRETKDLKATSAAPNSPGVFKRLGLYGLEGIAPVLVAALATEEPLLLIGPHGTAKSLVLTRVAAALGLEFMHYNASLLSFDVAFGVARQWDAIAQHAAQHRVVKQPQPSRRPHGAARAVHCHRAGRRRRPVHAAHLCRLAEKERAMISARTKAALAAKTTGVTSLRGIARVLDARGVATARGGTWDARTVGAVASPGCCAVSDVTATREQAEATGGESEPESHRGTAEFAGNDGPEGDAAAVPDRLSGLPGHGAASRCRSGSQ